MDRRTLGDVLTTAGRRVRVGATGAVVLLLLAGTFVGQDDDFPFGPFRMYSTRDDPDGTVQATRFEAVDSTGRTFAVPDLATGLRRAELEGQAARFVADPALLSKVSEAHDRLHPDEPPYRTLRVLVSHVHLRDSRPTGVTDDDVLATWTRP
ncbi:MAG: hypothetical protein JWL64_692 [Frankiales bacterium]|nr:hypothetical protein [Frankiales bacterium]